VDSTASRRNAPSAGFPPCARFARNQLRLTPLPCESLGQDALGRIALIDDDAARSALGLARKNDHRFVTSAAAEYPSRLHLLCDPLPGLYYRGDLDALQERTVAVVGSRGATPYGRSMSASIVTGFAQYGVTILSGLARSIDAAAHRAATGAGIPTVTVIDSGLCALYPAYHSLLADEIAKDWGAQ
jgi:DNA processing protein